MAETAITPQKLTTMQPSAPLTLTWTAADVANGNKSTAARVNVLLVDNTGASPYTVTVTSVADAKGRTRDITAASVPAGESRYIPLEREGWAGANGDIFYSANNAAIKFAFLHCDAP